MKFLIPSFLRASTIKTHRTLERLGVPKKDIIIGVQTKDDYRLYRESCEGYTVIFGEASNAAANRNNLLDYAESKGEKRAILVDDDITSFMRLKKIDGKLHRSSIHPDQFGKMLEDGFALGGVLFSIQYPKHSHVLLRDVQRGKVRRNSLFAGIFIGISDTSLRFNEVLNMGEDYELIARVVANGYDVYTLTGYQYNAPRCGHNDGGCHKMYELGKPFQHAQLSEVMHMYPGLLGFTTKSKDCTTLALRNVL